MTTSGNNEAEIRELIAHRDRALGAKDVDGFMDHYADALVLFDLKPPLQTRGIAELRAQWGRALSFFPDSFGTETRDLHVLVSGDLAVAHYIWRFTGIDVDHPAMHAWFRNTVVCQRAGGKWQIAHEHCSVPFDPITLEPAFELEP